MIHYLRYAVLAVLASFIIIACDSKKENIKEEGQATPEDIQKIEQEFKDFGNALEDTIGGLYRDMATAYWQASLPPFNTPPILPQ